MPATTAKAIITQAASSHGIDPSILWGVFGTETSFGKNVTTSSAGALGPLQLEPGTAKSLGVKDPNNLEEAANGAAKYLAEFKSRGTAGMLSAYNAGPAGGIQSGYVKTTLANAQTYGGSAPGIVSAALPTTTPSTAVAGMPVVVKAATTTKALDVPALEAANRKVQANRFVADSFGGGEGNPLRGILDLTTPTPSSFETTTSTPAVTTTAPTSGGGSAAAQVPGLTAGGVGSAPISPSAPADVKGGGLAPAPGKVSLGTPIAKEFPAVYKAKAALERASGHPVSIAEIEKEVAAGTHAHHVVIAPTHGTVVGSYPTPSGQRAIVHHSNGKLEHVASTLPKGHQYLGGAVLGAPIGQQGG